MPNIAKLLKDEIQRVAKKEIKAFSGARWAGKVAKGRGRKILENLT